MQASFFLFFLLLPVAAFLCFLLYVQWRAAPDSKVGYWIAALLLFLLFIKFFEWLDQSIGMGLGDWGVLFAFSAPYVSLAALYRWNSRFRSYANRNFRWAATAQ